MEDSAKSPDATDPPRGNAKFLWTAATIFGFILLLISFLWVLFVSPAGQREAVQIDFNKIWVPAESPGPGGTQPVLRIAIASMISPTDNLDVYGELVHYLGKKLGREPMVLQRRAYREVNELIMGGGIDLGFVCTGAYLRTFGTGDMEPLVVPVVRGRHFYQAYIIVSRKAPYQSVEDLKGAHIAFTDPDSLTGTLYPTGLLRGMGYEVEEFFAEKVFTYSHSDSIYAVSRGLVDVASVSSLVYEYYLSRSDKNVAACRILHASGPLAMPPLVTGRQVSEGLKAEMKQVLLQMHDDPEGKGILNTLRIDSFISPEPLRPFYEQTLVWLDAGRAEVGRPPEP